MKKILVLCTLFVFIGGFAFSRVAQAEEEIWDIPIRVVYSPSLVDQKDKMKSILQGASDVLEKEFNIRFTFDQENFSSWMIPQDIRQNVEAKEIGSHLTKNLIAQNWDIWEGGQECPVELVIGFHDVPIIYTETKKGLRDGHAVENKQTYVVKGEAEYYSNFFHLHLDENSNVKSKSHVVIHEFGHVLGLGHVLKAEKGAYMHPYIASYDIEKNPAPHFTALSQEYISYLKDQHKQNLFSLQNPIRLLPWQFNVLNTIVIKMKKKEPKVYGAAANAIWPSAGYIEREWSRWLGNGEEALRTFFYQYHSAMLHSPLIVLQSQYEQQGRVDPEYAQKIYYLFDRDDNDSIVEQMCFLEGYVPVKSRGVLTEQVKVYKKKGSQTVVDALKGIFPK